MVPTDPVRMAEAFLSWWETAGVDTAVGERATSWLDRDDAPAAAGRRVAASMASPKPAPASSPAPDPTAGHAPPQMALPASVPVPEPVGGSVPSDARPTPPSPAPGLWLPDSIEDYARALAEGDARLAGRDGRTPQPVPTGALDAPVLIVVEGPEARRDDAQGWLTRGSGALLSAMLAATGIDAASTCITGWSLAAPGMGDALPEGECHACDALLARHVAIARPALVLALGRRVGRSLFGTAAGGSGLQRINQNGANTVVALLPALDVMTKRPGEKARCWATLRSARALVPARE